MKILTTLILAGFSLVLAIVNVIVDKNPRGGNGQIVEPLIRYDDESVVGLTLRRGGQELVMRKINKEWFFVSPEQDRINRQSMSSLLDNLNHLTILDRLSERELTGDHSLANLGMDADEVMAIDIEVVDGKRTKTKQILIGWETPKENSVYAAIAGNQTKQVAVVNGNPIPVLSYPFESLRERTLITAPAALLVEVGIKTNKEDIVIKRELKNNQMTEWRVVSPVSAKANQSKIEDWLSALYKLQIDDLASQEEEATLRDSNSVAKGSVLLQLKLYGKQQPVTLQLQKQKKAGDVFTPSFLVAKTSDRQLTYRLSPTSSLEGLPSKSADLRDRRLGKVALEVVDTIGIVPQNLFLKPSNHGKGWSILLQEKAVQADYRRVTEFLNQMDEPMIIDFIDQGNPADYGLTDRQSPNSSEMVISYLLPGKTAPDGSQGKPEPFYKYLIIGSPENEPDRLFAKYRANDTIYELNPGFALLIPDHPIKWRSRRFLPRTVNHFNIQKITRKLINPVVVTFHENGGLPKQAFNLEGESRSFGFNSAVTLRNSIAALECSEWILNSAAGFKALNQEPTAIFELESRELDRATGEIKSVVHTLTFADALADRDQNDNRRFVFGRLNDSQDIFVIEPKKFRLLINPIE